jgi:hypothetical protein
MSSESWKRIFLEQGDARVDDALRLAEHVIDKRTHGRVEEAMAMRRALSPRTGRRYKLTLICAFFRVSRSTV